MRHIGLSWRYTHPRLCAIDLGSLPNQAEDNVPEALRYDPTVSFWRERQLAERQTELAELQQNLNDAHHDSIQDACDGPPPATVRAYQRVHAAIQTVGLHKSKIRNDSNHMEKRSLKFNRSKAKAPLFVCSNGTLHFPFDPAKPAAYERCAS